MHYYPHHIGDYQRDTATLSVMEHGAYRLLMDAYYVTEKPLPTSLDELCRICRAITKPERSAVSKVVGQFFAQTPEGLIHKRIQEEIEVYRKQVERNRENGKRGGRKAKQEHSGKPTRNPVGSFSLTQGLSDNEPKTNPNQEPRANNKPHSPQAHERDDGLWPDPGEYPSLDTVRTWASAVMAPPECAEKWFAERTAEGWTSSNGRKPLRCEDSVLRPLFGFYATAWKANAATPRRNGYAKPAADSFDIKPSWEQ